VENFFSEQNLPENISETDYGAVVFDEESFDGDQVRRNTNIKYKIRLRAEQSSGKGNWMTSLMFPMVRNIGPRGDMFGGQEPGWSKATLL